MASCEKCWSDAGRPYDPYSDPVERYRQLVKERNESGQVCTPKEQAGQWWDEENQIDKRLAHGVD